MDNKRRDPRFTDPEPTQDITCPNCEGRMVKQDGGACGAHVECYVCLECGNVEARQ
jgi:ssDNA-binding Zn-finger/Zn-ribbon topoisomerase 1